MIDLNKFPKTISIGIPTLNRQKFLFKTVSNILKIKSKYVVEIIIVDQTNNKEIVKKNIKYFKKIDSIKIKYFHQPEPSVCRARNKIIIESSGDIVNFIDDDVILPKEYFNQHIKLYKNKGIVSTIGEIHNRDPNCPVDNMNIKTPFLGTTPCFNLNNIELDFKGSGISCNQTYLKKILIKVRGFDENFVGGYYEDDDIIRRIRRLGFNVAYNPEAFVVHVKAPMGGLRFDKIQPISFDKKFYSYLFFYVRYFKFNLPYIFSFYRVLRAGPLLKQNLFSLKNGILLWFKIPFMIYRCIKFKNLTISLIDENN